MKKQKDRWNKLLPYEKCFDVGSWVFLCLCIVFFTLDILGGTGVLRIPFDAFPVIRWLLVAGNACQAVAYRRTERRLANGALMMTVAFGLGGIWDIIKMFL